MARFRLQFSKLWHPCRDMAALEAKWWKFPRRSYGPTNDNRRQIVFAPEKKLQKKISVLRNPNKQAADKWSPSRSGSVHSAFSLHRIQSHRRPGTPSPAIWYAP